MALQPMDLSAVFGIFVFLVMLRIDKIHLMGMIISRSLVKSSIAAQQLDYPFRHLITHVYSLPFIASI